MKNISNVTLVKEECKQFSLIELPVRGTNNHCVGITKTGQRQLTPLPLALINRMLGWTTGKLITEDGGNTRSPVTYAAKCKGKRNPLKNNPAIFLSNFTFLSF